VQKTLLTLLALASFAIGDTATIVVRRASGPFDARVVMRALDEPRVRIESVANPSERQLRLRSAWVTGSP